MITLPCEPDAEEAVLGCMMLAGADLAPDLLTFLVPADFYDAARGKIWAAMIEVHGAGLTVDMITVAERMRTNRTMAYLAARDNEVYLTTLSCSVRYLANAMDYAKLVREASTLRKLAILGDRLKEQAVKRTRPADELLASLQADASTIADGTIDNPVVHIKAGLHELTVALEARHAKKQAITGVPSGIADLDELTGGYQAADLIVIAARPSMGKTAMILGNLLHANENKIPTLMFSIEMSAQKIIERCVSHNGRIDGRSMRTGYLTTIDWVHIAGASSRLSEAPFWIDDTGYQTLATLSTKARKWRRDRAVFPRGDEPALIAIDYLQLIKTEDLGRFTNRDREIGIITSGLHNLARELRLPVVALSQLNRSLESRADKRPMCSDLRESGSIEQDADLILFLYRDEKYNKTSPDKGIAEIIIGKQRNGPTGTVRAKFIETEARFDNLAGGSPDYDGRRGRAIIGISRAPI